MRFTQGIVNGKTTTVFIIDNNFYIPDFEGIECVLEDSKNIVKAIELFRNIKNYRQVTLSKFLPSIYPNKIFLPAVNFKSHSKESSMEPPKQPYFFMKGNNTVIAHEDEIIIPKGARKVDYEGEIGIILGKRGKYIKKENAIDYVLGFTIVNDVSFRDYQFPEIHPYGLNWVMGKSLDTGLPIGPWIVTKDEVDFPLEIITRVNGRVAQRGSTEDMIFSVEELISYLSNGITLEPGDIITTGTPAGVAEFGNKEYLKPGDIVEVEVPKIGILRNKVENEF
ncbi:fumarylacetoacetate hydrolase family protein [Acidianus sp. HS-5]|uniref:fumarylacetoacetate hydrolase family protein n=1 Tax=Acidianus sp. HS-5 TaxID=2886040 RepID=UPI001F28302F|nr:fumarylacetoacetate hydrolase family protein [Acidianus sp. HS-5]BDC17163.1 2-hydroxyhepta-2,4-diene-1,7-dioate isomerase [Acidianus sp. HS-5]